MDGLGQVQEYLRRRADGDASTTGVAKAAALAAAAAADKSGYTPSWDDMFRMNRQQLEQAARTLSRDDSLAPERKAYLMQHLLAARWICAQQRAKQLKKGEKGEDVDILDEAGIVPGERAAVGNGAADAGVDGAAEKTGTAPPPDTAEAALALAGAPGLASYHKGASDDVVLCQPVGGEEVLGCKHYARKVRLVAACCGAAHVCRFCHDESEDHTIDRYATKEMICMRCAARQPSAKECRECGDVVARYFCSVCNFWDDSGNDVYHCPFCNVCRRGEGLGKDFFHCMQCNSCVSLTMGPHVCPAAKNAKGDEGGGGGTVFAGSMESECPVCKDFLFYSDTPVKCLPCGHFMHTSCFQAYTKHYYTCPLCRKSLGDFSAYFRMLDAILAEEEEANATPGDDEEQPKRAKQRVACNDCGVESLAPFHFVYHACAECRSYNTRVLAVVPPSEVAKEEAKNDK